MANPSYTFTTPLWEWDAAAAWVFLSLSDEASDAIRAVPRPPKPGFGSIRVKVTLGGSTWRTSIFPDSKSGLYMLPVKKAVRAAEHVEIGDLVEVTVEILE